MNGPLNAGQPSIGVAICGATTLTRKDFMRLASRVAIIGALMCPLTATIAQGQAPTITVGTLVYTEYRYQLNRDSVTDSHLNNFDLTRAYINIVGKFPSGITARVTPDIFRGADGSLTFRLKYAYAALTPQGSALTPKFGVIHTPWLDWEEALWNYRMQGTMAFERFHNPAGKGYLSSSDLGFGVDGNIKYDFINFQVGVYDGEFYSAPEGDEYKDFEVRASVRLIESDDHTRVGGLRFTGYGAVGTPTGGGTRDRYIGMVSWKSKRFTLAGEFGRARDQLDQKPPVTGSPAIVPQTDANIFSAFGVFNFGDSHRFALMARWDAQDPNTDKDNDKQYRIIGGASYQISPEVRLLADVDNLWLQSGVYTNAVNSTRTSALFQMQIAF